MSLVGKMPIKLGPWVQGLNSRDATDAGEYVPASQVRSLINLDVDSSGTLTARPGCVKCGSTDMYTFAGTGIQFPPFLVLGSIKRGTGGQVWGDGPTAVVVSVLRDGVVTDEAELYWSIAPDVSWNLIPGGPLSSGLARYMAMFTYGKRAYIVSSSVGKGQYFTNSTTGGYVAVPNMPPGDLAFVVRDRAFIIDKSESRVYYSKATDPTIWAGPDGGFFDVSPGDSDGPITDAVFINNTIYIFKLNSTYIFTFESDPGVDGRLTPISKELGAYAATTTLNSVYLINRKSVYKLQNNYFTDIAPQLDLLGISNIDSIPSTYQRELRVNLEDGRLLIGPIAQNEISHYAMNLSTGAWSARKYADSMILPAGKSAYFDDGVNSGNGAGYVYSRDRFASPTPNTNYLCFTKIRAPGGRATRNLDTPKDGTVVSPEYSMTTNVTSMGDYSKWKRVFSVIVKLVNTLRTGDASITMTTAVGPDDLTPVQSQTVPVLGGKVPLLSYRFRSTSFKLDKPKTNLPAATYSDVHNLIIKDVTMYTNTHDRQVNTV